MMENDEKHQDQINAELDKFFSETGKEKAPEDFTLKIMQNLHTNSLASELLNKPVISLRWWVFIASLIFVFAVITYEKMSPSNTFLFNLEPNNFSSANRFFQSFSFSLTGITNSVFTSTWFFSIILILGIAGFNLYLQQRMALHKRT